MIFRVLFFQISGTQTSGNDFIRHLASFHLVQNQENWQSGLADSATHRHSLTRTSKWKIPGDFVALSTNLEFAESRNQSKQNGSKFVPLIDHKSSSENGQVCGLTTWTESVEPMTESRCERVEREVQEMLSQELKTIDSQTWKTIFRWCLFRLFSIRFRISVIICLLYQFSGFRESTRSLWFLAIPLVTL